MCAPGELRDAFEREAEGETAVRAALSEMEDEVMSSRRELREAKERQRQHARVVASLAEELVNLGRFETVDAALQSASPSSRAASPSRDRTAHHVSQRGGDADGARRHAGLAELAEQARRDAEDERRGRLVAEADLMEAHRREEGLKTRLSLAERTCTEVTLSCRP